MQNFAGAPGYMNLYFANSTPTDFTVAARAWCEAIKGLFPAGLTMQVPAAGDVVDESTGTITGSWSAPAVAIVTATGGGTNTGASGAIVRWETSAVRNGRRVRGRTFLVPLVSTAFESNGSLVAGTITTLTTATNGLLTAVPNDPQVWARPTPFTAGDNYAVTSAVIPDFSAVLKSRRT